ncbi:MAG: hypothetical protein ACYC96_04790 [Fimbriimonadaceae bacterium]
MLARDGGRCLLCGASATSVDHIATGCNRPINLRAVCDDCCRTRPFGDPTVLARPEVAQILDELAVRIAAPFALRCCDDATSWDWRAFLIRRQAQLVPEAAN